METKFKDWSINAHKAMSQDGQRCLWVGNGFMGFADYSHDAKVAMIVGLSKWDRYRLWRELRREMKNRLNAFLT